jgi:hypothetical protein
LAASHLKDSPLPDGGDAATNAKDLFWANDVGIILRMPLGEHGDADKKVWVSLRELEAVKKMICGNASADDRALASGMVARAETQAATNPFAAALEVMTLQQRKDALKAHYAALHEEQEQAGAATKPWSEARCAKPTHEEFLAWLDGRYPDRGNIGFLLSDLKHLDEAAYKKVDNWVRGGMTKETLQAFGLPSKITAYDPVRDADAPKSFAEARARAERGESFKALDRAYHRVAHHHR